jgi:hypothetical protein
VTRLCLMTIHMKKTLVLLLFAVCASSCATVPTGPLSPGEVRLLSMDIPGHEAIARKSHFDVFLRFQADGEPQIESTCFSWSADKPRCFKAKDVRLGTEPMIRQSLVAHEAGIYIITAYLLYTRDGKSLKSNEVGGHVTIGRKSKPQ